MNTTLKLKIGLLVSVIFFSIMTLVPSFYPAAPNWWKDYLAPEGLKLGLDLQGGMHLVLRVDLDKAEENSLDLSASDLKEGLAEKNITAVKMKSADHSKIIFTLPNTSSIDIVREVIKNDFPNLNIEIDAEAGSFPRITLQLNSDEIKFIRKNAVAQSLEIIRNRIDQFGVAEPVIIRQGEDEIVVQLPGVKDPKRAMGLIGQTAQLQFKLVAENSGIDLNQIINNTVTSGRWHEGEHIKKLNLALQSILPQNTEIYFEKKVDPQTHLVQKIPFLLESQILMTGEMVKNAQVRIGGNFNEPYVSLDLTGRGGKIFAGVTEKNVGRRLAIVLDDMVRSAPVIR